MSASNCFKYRRRHSEAEHYLWMPPIALRQYQLGKSVAGALFTIVFLGWMLFQWSNIMTRFVAAVFVIITVWVTVASVLKDHFRSKGRQIVLEPDALSVTTPKGTTRILLDDIADARWQQTISRFGLWFYGHDGRILAHLNAAFLANQEEAQAFLGWARQRASLPFEVHWPQEFV